MKRALVAMAALASAPLAAEEPAGGAAVALFSPALNVSDVEAELRFYVDGLGMTKLMQMQPGNRRETMLGFPGDTSRPGIILMDNPTATEPVKYNHGTGFDRLVLRVKGLPAIVERLRAQGHEVSDVHDTVMGYRVAMTADPEGYRLELVEAPAKPEN